MEVAPSKSVVPPPQTASSTRDLLARKALALIPSILAREDRNPHSPTYGCFDRDYWHHRSIDFPGGSAAESVLPLALAWALPLPGNPFHRRPELVNCVEAGIRYSARSAHPDGSCDESSPYERSTSAASASLLACVEAYRLIGLNDIELLQFFTRRADWLSRHRPRKQDATDLALTSLALQKAGRLLDTDRWSDALAEHIRRLLSMQDKEGWFTGNRSVDASKLTLILGLLAQLHQEAPSAELRAALTSGIDFAAQLVQPDGSFPVESCSPLPTEFHPHGFEIAGHWHPEALSINDQVIEGLSREANHCSADFPVQIRRCWSFILAWQHWVHVRPPRPPRPAGRQYFKRAGLLIDRRDGCELHISLKQGGIFTLWRNGKPVAADSNFSVQIQKRSKCFTAIASHCGHHDVQLDGHSIVVRGKLRLTDQTRLSTGGLVIRRMFMCSLGRFLPRVSTGSRRNSAGSSTPLRFSRTLSWENGKLHVTDELYAKKGWVNVRAVAIACSSLDDSRNDAGSSSLAPLQQWLNFSEQVSGLAPDAPLRIERAF
jgi:hypothetical protein